MKTNSFNYKKSAKLFVFDLDHTLIRVNSSFYFGYHLFRNKLLPLNNMLRLVLLYSFHKVGLVSIQKLHQATLNHFFRGLSAQLIQEQVDQFLQENLNKILYQPAYQELLKAQKLEHFTMILSSSPDFIVEKIASLLKLDHWDATRYQLDQSNHFSSLTSIMDGKQKALVLQNILEHLNLSKEVVTAYTDSYLDIPLLEMAHQPVGVNPDRKLRALCLKNQWQIL